MIHDSRYAFNHISVDIPVTWFLKFPDYINIYNIYIIYIVYTIPYMKTSWKLHFFFFFGVPVFLFKQNLRHVFFFTANPPNGRCVTQRGIFSKAGRRLLTVERLGVEMTWGEGWSRYTPPRETILPYKPTFPSFLGVKKPIYWGFKTFIFHGTGFFLTTGMSMVLSKWIISPLYK